MKNILFRNGALPQTPRFNAFVSKGSEKSETMKKGAVAVRKEWLEDLVIDEIMKLLAEDEVLEELADRIFDIQNLETSASATIQAQIAEVEKKLNNLVEAMAQGIYSQATKRVLDELEEQKKNLEIDLFKAEVKNPFLTKEQILFALYNYRKLDLTTTEGRHCARVSSDSPMEALHESCSANSHGICRSVRKSNIRILPNIAHA